MRAHNFILFCVLVVSLLTGCSPAASDATPAQQTLVQFFDSLQQGQYEQADSLYGGSYETMIDHNPELDPSDHAALWKSACTINGAQCLPVRTATLKQESGEQYIFLVEFSNPDGTLFVQGPCCGGNETDTPPVSQFEYRVQKSSDGNYLVLDPPVYMP